MQPLPFPSQQKSSKIQENLSNYSSLPAFFIFTKVENIWGGFDVFDGLKNEECLLVAWKEAWLGVKGVIVIWDSRLKTQSSQLGCISVYPKLPEISKNTLSIFLLRDDV